VKIPSNVAKVTGAIVGSGALLIGAVGPVAPATAAASSRDSVARTLDDRPGGMAVFYSNDEILQVCDVQKDGLRVWGALYWEDSAGSHRVWIEDANGSNPTTDCAVMDLNIAEGIRVTVEACLKDGANGERRYCYSATNGVA
jgi:hypothetical protein